MSNILAIDGTQYDIDSLSDAAKEQVQNLRFVDAEIVRLKNALAVYQTARNAYNAALKKEISAISQ